jgi:hypothetical protein
VYGGGVVIPKVVLDVCTLLGGLSALWFFVERLMPAGAGRPVARTSLVSRVVLTILTGMPMSTRVALGLQWVLTVYTLSYFNTFAAVIGVLLPVWVVPLGILIQRFITPDPGVARIVGSVAGSVLGASIAHALIDWATPQGVVTGLFFSTLVTGHMAAPSRKTSAFSLLAGIFLLLWALGVFQDLKYFLRANDEGFLAAAFAMLMWLYMAIVAKTRTAQNLWRHVCKDWGYFQERPPAD